MSKKRTYTTILIILILAFFAGYLVYPGIFKIKIPYLSDIPFKLGLDLQGGTHLIYEADLSNVEQEDHSASMQGLRDIIERRVNIFGVQEPIVQIQGADEHPRLIVELAGIKDPAQAIELIGGTPFLEFKEQLSTEESDVIIKNILGEEAGEISAEAACNSREFLINFILAYGQDPCFKATNLNGKYLKSAENMRDQTTYKHLIWLQFDDEGAKIFEELTERNIGKPLAIYIDGFPISIPVVQEKISGGKAQITGNFTFEEAKSLAQNLNAGALPVPINLISQQSVGPTLGALSLEKSLKAGIIGFLVVILYMIVIYRLPGLLSSLALGIYIILLLAIFKLMSVTLTLAGVGGFILSIGMAVDANILIFSRLREELRGGKSFLQSIEDGFSRAWSSIRDGNLTTLIVTIILFSFGTSFIKGFALTLSLGVLISMFSAIIITKNLLSVFAGTKLEKIKRLWV